MEPKKKSLLCRVYRWLPTFPQMILFPVIHLAIYEATNRISLYGRYFPVYCSVDEKLPLVKWFLIPYCLWFLMVFGTAGLYLLDDNTELRRYVKFLITSIIPVYPVLVFYPSTMPLRPDSVEGADLLTRGLDLVFLVDNNNSVFPSLHVLWAIGAMIALMRSKRFRPLPARLLLVTLTVLICISTFMIKQHSVLDMIGALPFALIGWAMTYRYAGCEDLVRQNS